MRKTIFYSILFYSILHRTVDGGMQENLKISCHQEMATIVDLMLSSLIMNAKSAVLMTQSTMIQIQNLKPTGGELLSSWSAWANQALFPIQINFSLHVKRWILQDSAYQMQPLSLYLNTLMQLETFQHLHVWLTSAVGLVLWIKSQIMLSWEKWWLHSSHSSARNANLNGHRNWTMLSIYPSTLLWRPFAMELKFFIQVCEPAYALTGVKQELDICCCKNTVAAPLKLQTDVRMAGE